MHHPPIPFCLSLTAASTLLLSIMLTGCEGVRAARYRVCGIDHVPESTLLLLGEIHGSQETPSIAGRVACSYSLDSETALGLELLTSDQANLEEYLESNGDLCSRQKLLGTSFWKKTRDGRSSAAMFELIEYVRRLRRQGLPISVFAFDAHERTSQVSRDAALANGILRFREANPDAHIVALMGNIHASELPVQLTDSRIATTGTMLASLEPTSVLVMYRSGSVWACMPECGVHEVSSQWSRIKTAGFLRETPKAGYDYAYVVSRATASPPAVMAISPLSEPRPTADFGHAFQTRLRSGPASSISQSRLIGCIVSRGGERGRCGTRMGVGSCWVLPQYWPIT
jgi:hypothetical protein